MPQTRILVVEDDPATQDQVKAALAQEGYIVRIVASGIEALEMANTWNPNLMVLDIQLGTGPMDGIEVLRRLHEHSDTCVLMLTSTSVAFVKVAALEMGADDFLTKPFNPEELVARVRAILRRAGKRDRSTTVIECTGLRIDTAANLVWKQDTPVELTPIEFALLVVLVQRQGETLRRAQLIHLAWDHPFVGDDRIVDVHIRRLRQKIEDHPEHPTRIVTVWGKGYRFNP